MEEAIARYGKPEIVNTDEGSPFTSRAFTDLLREQGIPISMDGKGAWRDNVFVERLWRSVKHEEVYLHACDTVSIAAADPGCLNDRLRSTYRIGFCCPNKRGRLCHQKRLCF